MLIASKDQLIDVGIFTFYFFKEHHETIPGGLQIPMKAPREAPSPLVELSFIGKQII